MVRNSTFLRVFHISFVARNRPIELKEQRRFHLPDELLVVLYDVGVVGAA